MRRERSHCGGSTVIEAGAQLLWREHRGGSTVTEAGADVTSEKCRSAYKGGDRMGVGMRSGPESAAMARRVDQRVLRTASDKNG